MAKFKAGEVGNPNGRTPGTKNKQTKLREALMGDAAESVIGSVIEAAKDGDMIAAKLCLERIYPKPQLPPEKLPEGIVDAGASHAEQSGQVLQAVADGAISAALGDKVIGVILSIFKRLSSPIWLSVWQKLKPDKFGENQQSIEREDKQAGEHPYTDSKAQRMAATACPTTESG